jgi:ABC-type transporter lipoprotein component MlaA
VQELPGVTGEEILGVRQKCSEDLHEEKAAKHLLDGVKHYGRAIVSVAKAINEGVFKPVTKRYWPKVRSIPKKIGKKLSNWAKGIGKKMFDKLKGRG